MAPYTPAPNPQAAYTMAAYPQAAYAMAPDTGQGDSAPRAWPHAPSPKSQFYPIIH